MPRKCLAFDLETAKPFPDGEDWQAHRPLGIACAATLTHDGDLRLWHSKTTSGQPAPKTGQPTLQRLVQYLNGVTAAGYTVLTWNGLGFDFDILAEESGMFDECRDLALAHVDMMFHFFCLKGYMLGLDAAAKGAGLAGKPPGMSGAQAPQMWADGQYAEVLNYLEQDVRTTLKLALRVEEAHEIRWTSRRGSPCQVPVRSWLCVEEANRLPLPDTSWMDRPHARDRFTRWMNR